MKHLFAVTSHLTFFIALRIQQHFNLLPSDCVLLLLRGYFPPKQFLSPATRTIATHYNIDEHSGRIFAGLKLRQTSEGIKTFDRLITDATANEPFVWYTPVCSNDICSLVVTNPKCQAYYVTEDGLASYRDFNPQTFKGMRYGAYLLLRAIYPRLFAVKNHFITTEHPKFKGCLATSDECFPLHKHCLTVVGSPFQGVPYVPIEADAVLSIDPLYQFLNDSETEQYFMQLGTILRQQGYKQIACKWHPRFNNQSNTDRRRQYVRWMNEHLPEHKLMPQRAILEPLLCNEHIDFYSCASSVAIYAAQAGCKCYNTASLLPRAINYASAPIINKLTTAL